MQASRFGWAEDRKFFDIANWEDLESSLFEAVLIEVFLAKPVEFDISNWEDLEAVLSRRNYPRSSPPSAWSS